jgi:hypothetical protein
MFRSSTHLGSLRGLLLLLVAGWLTLMAVPSQAQTVLNVTNFGARGDAVQIWADTTGNSSVVVFANVLTSADIGKTVELFGVGDVHSGNNVNGVYVTNAQDLIAIITNVVNGTNIYISPVPSVTSSGVYCIYGTQNAPAFQAAVEAASGTNTIINIPAGNYLLIPPQQYTNYIYNPNVNINSDSGILIRKGGLHFVGAGRDSTILMGDGAFKNQGGVCMRGMVFICEGPVTNDYPLIWDSLTFDGGLQYGDVGNEGTQPANPIDGIGWDGTSAAGCDTGSEPLNRFKEFINCNFQHMRGEMIKGITGSARTETILVTNCVFTDGNATAFNYNFAHTITGCTFSNMYQVEEFYLTYPTNAASYFINNYCTNLYHGIIALNGGTLTNEPYIISNNTFYCTFNAVAIGMAPAANVTVISNTFTQVTNFFSQAITMNYGGGAQPGSTNAFNTNIVIAGNTFINQWYSVFNWGGANSTDCNRAAGVQVYGNNFIGVNASTFLTQGWATNVHLYSNEFSGATFWLPSGVSSGGAGSQFALIDTNNDYWANIYDNIGVTNYISYANGSKFQIIYAYKPGTVWALVDTNGSQIPSGAQMLILNNASQNQSNEPIYLDTAMTKGPISLPYGQTLLASWTNGAWVNMTGATNPPPANPTNHVSSANLLFGTILSGLSVTGSFTVQNVGGGTLSGTASVGAPFSIVSGGSYSLSANASQTVTVSFNPTTAGSYSQNVTLTGGGGATVAISGSATNAPVNPAIHVSSPSLPFGTVLSGTSVTGGFTVQNVGGGTLSGAASVGAPFAIVSGGSYNLGANASQTVTVSFNPISAGGYNQNVTLTGGGGASVGVSGSATNAPIPTPVLQVAPGSIAYGTILNGTSATNSFTVQNIGTGTLTGTASVGAPFSIVSGGSYSLGANASQTVTVAFSPTAASNYNQSVTFTGGNGTNTTVTGSATNAPVPTPVLQVTPGSIAYGTILNGTSATNSFTVQNIGSGTLIGTASVGAPFSIVSGGSYSLGAGQVQAVVVAFNPLAVSNYNQTVTFTGGNGTNTTVTGSATNAPVPTPVLQVTPGSIAYGTILNGTSKTNSFTVQNIGTGTLIGTASVGVPFSIVSGGSYSLDAGQVQAVVVAFSPLVVSNYNQSVTFTGGNGTNATVTGSATNAPVPTPVLQVTPGSIAYGTILNGTSKTNSFTVQNIGTGTLTGTASVGAPFSIVSGGSYSLGAGASQPVTVIFSPTVANNYNQSVTFAGGNGANTTVTGSATDAPPVLPTVSAINVNATDVDLSLPGLQIYAGTTVQFSATATNAQTWQWSYTVNGGAPVVWTNGTSPITNISGYFGTNTIGNSYVWTLVVSNSQGWAESQTNLEVEAVPNPGGGTTNTGLIFTATNGVLSGMLMGNIVINGVSSSYIFLPSPAPGDISSGTAVFNITIATAGNYEIQALVDAPGTSANTFAVNMDAAPQDPTMIWDILPITSGFEQRIVSWRGSGTANNDQFVPKVFGLSAGAHQILFKGEGPGTALASFTLLQVIPAAPAAQAPAKRSIQSSPAPPPTTPDGLRIISSGP